jgi:hypothetical protein
MDSNRADRVRVGLTDRVFAVELIGDELNEIESVTANRNGY